MSDRSWYVAVGGQQQGPMSRDEVVAGIRSGRIGRDAHVFTQGMSNWVPIGTEPELAGAFATAPPPPPGAGAAARAHEIDYELHGEDMQFVEITLDPGEAIPWHHHSEVADYYYGLEGVVLVETRDPAARHEIRVGQSAKVEPPSAHHVSNPGRSPCRFLLVQAVGKYDFVREER